MHFAKGSSIICYCAACQWKCGTLHCMISTLRYGKVQGKEKSLLRRHGILLHKIEDFDVWGGKRISMKMLYFAKFWSICYCASQRECEDNGRLKRGGRCLGEGHGGPGGGMGGREGGELAWRRKGGCVCPELIVQPSASAPAQRNPILFGRFVRLVDSEGTRTSCRVCKI